MGGPEEIQGRECGPQSVRPATQVGDWSFISRETVDNDAEHAQHKYPAQEGREPGY